MAESGLSVGWTELKQRTGFFLGYGRTIGDWTSDQATEVEDIVQSGVRRVYFPVSSDPRILGYEWSWVRPSTTLTLADDDYDYDLPDDFHRLVGQMNFAADTHYAPVKSVSLDDLLEMRSIHDRTGPPQYVAIRRKAEDRTAGQRWEALFWPEPDGDYTLSYKYEAYSGALSDSYPYALGGMAISELLIESCLAVAEQQMNDEASIHTAMYERMLLGAIMDDRKRGAASFGHMGHREFDGDGRVRHGDTGGTYPITYKEETI